MQIGFNLKRPEEKKTAIYADISYQGYRMKYFFSESIEVKNWNKITKRAKVNAKFPEHPEFNARLENISASIKTIYRKYINDGNPTPSTSELKKLLDSQLKTTNQKSKLKNNFLSFFEELIRQSEESIRLNLKTGKPLSRDTIKTYKTVRKHIEEYATKSKKQIEFELIDLDFYIDFTEYLSKDKHLSTNSIGKTIKIIKLVMNEAKEHNLHTNTKYKSKRFAVLEEKSESIYLNEIELQEILKLDLAKNQKLERVRDLFLIGCYTGLRFSDFSTLDPKRIKDGMIEVVQEKTNASVVIPIHPVVLHIL
ncbi:MAG: site-specific integrase, partial [Chitinophagales bacterium]